jgi:hypothetical protein
MNGVCAPAAQINLQKELSMKYLRFLVLSLVALVACNSVANPDVDPTGINPVDPVTGTCLVQGRTFDDDVAIPRNTSCTFDDVQVEGNIKLASGASLSATGLTVDGNIQAEGADSLNVTDSDIRGNIQFKQGGSADVRRTLVDGDIQYEENTRSGSLISQDNTINGNLQIDKNRASVTADNNIIDGDLQLFENNLGPFSVINNRIDGNLQCKENSPAPTGSGNQVNGNKEDQCATF